jgi:2-polyprenyl-3-methyl-5-hydroxy-6-metoxy-1,4-benzoquinol methylase
MSYFPGNLCAIVTAQAAINMEMVDLSERQRRELAFYEEFSELNSPSEVCFDAISGQESRPWNSYWHIIDLVQDVYADGRRILDFGCGKGEMSILYSKIGYCVHAFDISPNNIGIAKRLAMKYGVTDKTDFTVSVAEKLDYSDGFFDVVVGTDILHHVDIPRALAECRRVLKPGGIAIFHEPIRTVIFDRIRETRFGRWLVPKEASLERHVTEDERKLSDDDLALIAKSGFKTSQQRFLMFSRLDRFIRSSGATGPSLLERLDHGLFRMIPPLQKFGGIVVIKLARP